MPGYADDGKDDTAALGWCLNPNEVTHRSAVYFEGHFRLSGTITTYENHGLNLYSAGRILNWQQGPRSSQRGAGSVIRWDGEPGGVMWTYKGAGVSGHLPTLNGMKKAAIGLLVTRDKALNPTKSAIDSFTGLGLKTAIQLGRRGVGELGCDNFYSQNTYLEECEVGVRFNTPQSMDHHFDVIYANDVKVLFRVDSGGRFSADSITVIERTKTILSIGEGMIGGNNGSFWLKCIKADTPTKEVRIVDMDASKHVVINIDGVQVASPAKVIVYRIIAPAVLTVRDHNYLRPGAIEALPSGKDERQVANVLVERCLLGANVVKGGCENLLTDASDECVLSIRDCYDVQGRPVPDKTIVR